MIKREQNINHKIVQYAKSKGFLTPLWLLPNTDAEGVKRAFQELETFLQEAYLDGDLSDLTPENLDEFVWKLKKIYAFKGWEGIAPYLLNLSPSAHKLPADLFTK